MKHLFTIGEDVWDSVDFKTVVHTVAALEEAGLYNMPYPEFDIQGTITKPALEQLFSNIDEKTRIKSYTFRYLVVADVATPIFTFKLGDKFLHVNEIADVAEKQGINGGDATGYVNVLGSFFLHALVSLLATKNAQKITEKIKKHGPKSRKRPREYDYITTIKIGKITETQRGDGDGQSSVRPHLRRGHIRNQRVGKGLSEVKPIFIQPCFINADESWINNQRKEYRIAA